MPPEMYLFSFLIYGLTRRTCEFPCLRLLGLARVTAVDHEGAVAEDLGRCVVQSTDSHFERAVTVYTFDHQLLVTLFEVTPILDPESALFGYLDASHDAVLASEPNALSAQHFHRLLRHAPISFSYFGASFD